MKNCFGNSKRVINMLARSTPQAVAQLRSEQGVNNGTAMFFQTRDGLYCVCSVSGLCGCSSNTNAQLLPVRINFNSGNRCSQNSCSGELAPLLLTANEAWGACLTDNFCVSDIIGRTLTVGGCDACGTIVENNT